MREEAPVDGLSRVDASIVSHAYSLHRHDTYTIALTASGVQEFDYRGRVHRSLPGQVVILHPDELHDGRPGTVDGFRYRGIHLDPARVYEVGRCMWPRFMALPFVENPVLDDPQLANTMSQAFVLPVEPLGADELVHAVSTSLMHASRQMPFVSKHRAMSDATLSRVREFLDAHCTRVVVAGELEAACGESRYTIAAQFKQRYGTSPYRYLMMRRLEQVRSRLLGAPSLAVLAHEAGFADQAHLTRMFKLAFGMTPAAYADRLRSGFIAPARARTRAPAARRCR